MQSSHDATCLVGSWTVSTVDELASARAWLQDALCDGRPWLCGSSEGDRSVLANIVLAASELMANALRHAGGPARLDVVLEGRSLTVSVMDRSPDEPPVLSPDRELGAGGFGLQLTLRMADDVGWYRTPTGAKHVWARFALPATPEARPTTEAGPDLAPTGADVGSGPSDQCV
jgi:serine/threonine-protein kinase RsbW